MRYNPYASEHESKYRPSMLYMYFQLCVGVMLTQCQKVISVWGVPYDKLPVETWLDRLPGLSLIAFSLSAGDSSKMGCYYYFSIRHHLCSFSLYYYPSTFLPVPFLYSFLSVVVVLGLLSFSFPQHPSSATTRIAR